MIECNDIDFVRHGQVWVRDPNKHPEAESFACNLGCPGSLDYCYYLNGPRITIGSYIMVSNWYDHLWDGEKYRRGGSREPARWYHLVNYGWIHQSNLFGFFSFVQ